MTGILDVPLYFSASYKYLSVKKDYHTIVQAGNHLVEMYERQLSSNQTTVHACCILQFVAVHPFDLIGPMQACVV